MADLQHNYKGPKTQQQCINNILNKKHKLQLLKTLGCSQK